MSSFAVNILKLDAVETHPNADSLDIATIGGYRSIVKRGQFRAGDLVAYIPEAAVLPKDLLQHLGFWNADKACGTLNGARGDRVKAIHLRGVLSQGICLTVVQDSAETGQLVLPGRPDGMAFLNVRLGDDVAAPLGVEKYQVPVPVHLAGEIFCTDTELTAKFDVEDWKRHPLVFEEGEPVIFTEKLHGTFTGISLVPEKFAHEETFGPRKNVLLYSKGLGAEGMCFKNNAANENNAYVRATAEAIAALSDTTRMAPGEEPFMLLGETFGAGVQDGMNYGIQTKPKFRVFAAIRGFRSTSRYVDFAQLCAICTQLGLDMVPVLYQGPFSAASMRDYANGKTSLQADHTREGLVVTPQMERHAPGLGRVAVKYLSTKYLLMKGRTDYN